MVIHHYEADFIELEVHVMRYTYVVLPQRINLILDSMIM